jgi:hypothetical protein
MHTIDRTTAKICLHRPWPLGRLFWLGWFLNSTLACLKAFTGSDAAARKKGSLYLLDINIPFLQVAFGGADVLYFDFTSSIFPLYCVLCVYYFHFHSRLATQGSSAMGQNLGKLGIINGVCLHH